MESKECPIIAYANAIDVAVADKFLAVGDFFDVFGFFTSVITLRMEPSILPESFLTDFAKSLEYSTFIRQATFQSLFFPAGSECHALRDALC